MEFQPSIGYSGIPVVALAQQIRTFRAGIRLDDTIPIDIIVTIAGDEMTVDLTGIADGLGPRSDVRVRVPATDGATREFSVMARIDTPDELTYFRHGGILPYVLRQFVPRTG